MKKHNQIESSLFEYYYRQYKDEESNDFFTISDRFDGLAKLLFSKLRRELWGAVNEKRHFNEKT